MSPPSPINKFNTTQLVSMSWLLFHTSANTQLHHTQTTPKSHHKLMSPPFCAQTHTLSTVQYTCTPTPFFSPTSANGSSISSTHLLLKWHNHSHHKVSQTIPHYKYTSPQHSTQTYLFWCQNERTVTHRRHPLTLSTYLTSHLLPPRSPPPNSKEQFHYRTLHTIPPQSTHHQHLLCCNS